MAGNPFGKTPTPGDVRKMVAADRKVPDKLRNQYRKKVIGQARRCGAMQHIPDHWVGSGKGSSKGN